MPSPRLHLPAPGALRYAGFGLALAVLAAVGAVTVWSFDRSRASEAWVEHTYQVISTVQVYRLQIRNAESTARGARLTGRPALRDAFLVLIPPIQQQLVELTLMVADNPAQHARARRLQELNDRRLALSRQLMAADATANLQGTFEHGSDAMQDIDRVSTQMLAEEHALLVQRQAQSTRQRHWLIASTSAGTTFAMLLLALLMRGLQREIKRSRRLEVQAQDALAGMHDSMTHLALLSEQRAALSRYTSLLQSCQDVPEALQVTGRVMAELLPGMGGRVYLLRPSQDLAESAAAFGTPAAPSAELLQPLQCWALRKGQLYRADRLADSVTCAHVDVSAVDADAWSMCVPLLAQGVALGLLHVSGVGASARDQTQSLLETVAEQLGLALVNLQLRESLRAQALRDSLTGLFNRRYLDESLQREVTRCRRRGAPLAVMMLDVDHFKRFNDTHGHGAGDAMLARIGQLLSGMMRNEDLACRYGGEEFTLVLPDASRANALRRADDIRAAVRSATIQYLHQTLGPCTVSIGLAMQPENGQAATVLMAQADAALYRAKAEGRDRVVAADDATHPLFIEGDSST